MRRTTPKLRAWTMPVAICLVVSFAAAASPGESSAARTAARSLPACPHSASYGSFPHPNCLIRPWTTNEGMPISGTVKVTKTSKRLGGWFYDFTVTTAYTSPPGNVCPAGAVPYALIPCHYPGVGSAIVGLSVPGAKTLAAAPVSGLDNEACDPHSPCVRHYQVSASLTSGHMTLVVQVNQGDVTRAANDLGSAGFEAAINVTVPKYTGKPPACLALGKC